MSPMPIIPTVLESPYASHLLYTHPGTLRDDAQDERDLRIRCGFAWAHLAERRAFYVDRGAPA